MNWRFSLQRVPIRSARYRHGGPAGLARIGRTVPTDMAALRALADLDFGLRTS